MEEDPQPCLLQQRLDPLTGTLEWVVAGQEADSSNDVHAFDHLAFTSYLDMLNDRERNRAYEKAIRKAVCGPCHVLDIGAGTGLLSLVAARALQESSMSSLHMDKGTVTACEAFPPMFQLAEKVLKANGMSSSIHLVQKRSEELEVGHDMSNRADVLVIEIFDSELLGEGLIPTLQHAHDFLLKPNAHVVPYKATIYGQLVECDYLWRLHDLQGAEALIGDGLVLAPCGSKQAIGVRPLQYALHVDAISDQLLEVSEPFEVFTFNFCKRLNDFAEVVLQARAIRTGVAHAVISWWVLELDKEGSVVYSTAPKWIKQAHHTGCFGWHDHWKQCVWFIPGGGLLAHAGEQIRFRATHDEISVKYEFDSERDPFKCSWVKGNRNESPDLFVKPERMVTLGSARWRAIIIEVVKKALQGRSSSLCLVLDDSLPLTVAAAANSTSTSVVAMLPGLRSDGLNYLQTVSDANQFAAGQVKVLGKNACEMTHLDIGNKKVDLVLAEPYYWAFESMLPWVNLRFWNERTISSSFLSEKSVTVPCQGILCGMAMSLPDLWLSRQCLTMLEGFDHSCVNRSLGACGGLPIPLEGPILPYAMWQCGEIEELTEPFSIMKFDFLKPIETLKNSVKVPISKSGLCHGVVFWIDWVMELESNIILSTGASGHHSTCSKQGVKLLTSPAHVRAFKSENNVENLHIPCMLNLSAIFDKCNGEVTIDVDLENHPT